jgi:hypothetical protein
MKKLWEKIVAWFLAKWTALKAWFIAKPWAWFKKHWMVVVNFIVIFLAYNNVYGKTGVGFAEVLLGLWLFVCAAYGLYTIFAKTPPVV